MGQFALDCGWAFVQVWVMALNYQYLVVEGDQRSHLLRQLGEQDPKVWRCPRIFETTYECQEDAQATIHRILGRSYPVIAARFRVPPPSKRLEAANLMLRQLLDQLEQAETPAATGRLQKKVNAQRNHVIGIKRSLAPKSQLTCWLVGAITEE